MKKIILLIGAALACSAVTASAQDSVSVAVKNIAENGSLTQQVIVTGVFDTPDDNVLMVVRDSSSQITALEQETTGADGGVAFTFYCDTADTYTGHLNSETGNVNLPFSFSVLSEEDYNVIVDEFNSATKETIADIIADNASALSFDTTYYTEKKKSEIEANMLGECGKLTIFTLNESFDKSVIYAYLFGDETVAVKNEILGYYDSLYYNLAAQDNAKKLYQSFLGFDEDVQEKVYSRLAADRPKTLSEFADAFNEAVVLTAVSELDNTELDTFLIDNSDLVKLESYGGYTIVLRNAYINELKASGAASIAELVKAYNAAVEAKNNSSSSSSSSSNSGGGGGNDGRVIGVPVVRPPKEETGTIQPVTNGFTDLAGYEWAEAAIKKLSEYGIVSGKGESLFCPGEDITRAEFVTIVVLAFRLLDENAECEFADVPKNDWSYKYVASGFKNGIINGVGEDKFGGGEKITREQMAAILYRTIRNTTQLERVETVNNNLKDFDTVSGYAQNSVLMLSNLKIINGFEDGSFAPKNYATRAEVSVMINNALEVLANA